MIRLTGSCVSLVVLLSQGCVTLADRVSGVDRDKFHISCFSVHGSALSEQHVKKAKEAGLDYITGGIPATDPEVLRYSTKQNMEICGVALPRVVGNDKSSEELSREHPREELEKLLDKFNAAQMSPIVRMINICDEPGVQQMAWLGDVVRLVGEKCPHTTAYINLLPNYAQAAESDAKVKESQLGTTSYRKYIEEYCRLVPTSYIMYDNYPVMQTAEATKAFSPVWYENLMIVADACRRTNRDLWVGPQANSRPNGPALSENHLRYQAFSAMAFGAVSLTWACWGQGWWNYTIVNPDGTLSCQYEKVKNVNAEIRTLAEHYMKLRNVATHFVGFGDLKGELGKKGIVPVAKAQADGFSDIMAADRSSLVVGEMVPRKNNDDIRALFVFGADDCGDVHHKTHMVNFMAKGKVRAFGPNGPVEVKKAAGGRWSFELADNSAALVLLKR